MKCQGPIRGNNINKFMATSTSTSTSLTVYKYNKESYRYSSFTLKVIIRLSVVYEKILVINFQFTKGKGENKVSSDWLPRRTCFRGGIQLPVQLS